MCGIHLCVSSHAHAKLGPDDDQLLRSRGPDLTNLHATAVSHGLRTWYLTFTASVLSLRGHSIASQPVIDDAAGSVLCWNGEAWFIDDQRVIGNDTKVIAEQLFIATREGDDAENAVLHTLSRISGPYAFVFYDATASKIYFGRDNLGRRSLIVSQDTTDVNELTVSSVATSSTNMTLREVDTLRVHTIDLNSDNITITSPTSRSSLPSINKSIPHGTQGLSDLPSHQAITDLLTKLESSLRPRVEAIPTYTTYGNTPNPSRAAVLFSGGLDCTLLARAIHEILPADQPVDLLNVAFENPRVLRAEASTRRKNHATAVSETDKFDGCPDRRTGLSSYSELVKTCPGRIWRFVRVDVPYAECVAHKPTIINLMHPHKTEMDLSITSALYFAARGKGSITQHGHTAEQRPEDYTTTARVLLSGLGADELFGGYGRHAAAFSRGGYATLNDELELDFNRIGTRNLGRDDRVIAHWGRETRYPFLDEQFVDFALGLPAWEKCGFRTGKEIPKHFEESIASDRMEDLPQDKMLLRCALWQLGMRRAATEKKRAIQFGARTAKMQSGRSKGTDDVTLDDAGV